MITTRRVEQRARARALQALYAADMRGGDTIGRVTMTLFSVVCSGEVLSKA